uniref:zinc transporter ZIP2-like n=1 Tax=Ciona intestinalis TaxID=7719 RepID=UPI000180C1F4|nr:zinc transporter ZIP2-like [Ciona intestinalis]|eukprot:XP_002122816.1 zinc transporter ZIP2-like [Ciona intestinalis]
MDLLVEKLVLLLFLFILGFGAGIGPYLLRNRCLSPSRFRDLMVSSMNCLSAGVFFSTFFMHMLPEAQEEFASVFGETGYPFAELLVSLGFFFVMLIEQFVLTCYDDNAKQKTTEGNMIANSYASANFESSEVERSTLSQNNPNYHTLDLVKDENNGRDRKGSTQTEVIVCEGEQTVIKVVKAKPTQGHSHGHADIPSHSSVRAIILLFALSAHALFEGLAIGLQTSTNALRTLVVAVLIHKMALAFSYGISLISDKANLKSVLTALTIFSIMAPIGIGVGAALTSAKEGDDVIEKIIAITQAFASGTFVYVIFIEIIPHEFTGESSDRRMSKVTCMMAGFAVMASLQALPHEE